MTNLSVFQYQSAREFLRDSISEMKRTTPDFSLRKFCKTSNFGSHTLLILILNGRRRMTLKQVPSLSEGLGLTSEEKLFFQTLIQLDNATTDEEKNLCKLWLNDINPKKEYRIIEVEQFHAIADWIHMAILTLAKIEGAVLTPESIYHLTGQKTPLPKVREAISRLIDLGLLTENNGKLTPTYNSVKSKDDVANRGVREYHKQVSRLAIEAVEDFSPELREFQGFALTLPMKKLKLAKDMIRKFRHQLTQVMEAEAGEVVYQCNLQFFQLAACPSNNSKETNAELQMGESSNIQH